ncbi:DNA helicase-2 / ATP-dependent DNA helicase PcrA [Pelagirhabdus alkalitolerans]|uniref:DNA helicase-2 / ATP-dependent DNA helicase PcrA n=1 Tax=Pelagirhabdus alkalitolerans TaxID=1612202 RepID=A0A1G6GJY6_9BACI|nr:RNA polymerase recycling motor HelD [Pelagirhabdus alkalitolerans]SDB82254.1 DNA helicase-2 / ATP-dependent DNA helicase PcrA [Pelagirhabdus alkalitolerans]
MPKQNQEWEEEYKRMQQVGHLIDKKIKRFSQYMRAIKDRVIDIKKDFWDDVTVNLTELDDALETQASLKQQAEFLSERERTHGQLAWQLSKLQKLQHKPYFGRIDFREDGTNEAEKIYIGTSSLMDENEEDFLIYDWRAPISSMYYDFPPGDAHYEAVDETIHGELTLKRQYVTKQGELTGMFDTGITIGDGLLQSVLGQSADTTMKSIVATIQREQNRIIRNETHRYLVVQGVAGSGKTSAAMQRVAYLLYRYRQQMKADQMILFSPNPLFNGYVSRVLPELGEDNIKQTTFYEYIEGQLGDRFVVESPFEQLELSLSRNHEDQTERMLGMRHKATKAFQEQVDRFIDQLHYSGVEFRTIRFRGDVILSKNQLSQYFYKQLRDLPLQQRVEKLMRYILRHLKEIETTLIDQDWVEDELQLLDKADLQEAFSHLDQETIDHHHEIDAETQYLKQKIVKRALLPLQEKVKRFNFINVKKTYEKLYDQPANSDEMTEEEWQKIAKFSKQYLNENFLAWEDATPFLYFEKMLTGFNENREIKHVFIDEAQDYSPFQIRYLKRIYPSSYMTLLGDYNQSIYYHALLEDSIMKEERDDHHRIQLMRSYRSTKEIVDFTRSLIPGGDQIEPFNRAGELPEVIEVDHDTIAEYKLYQLIDRYEKANHQTIAVVTKNRKQADRVARLLRSTYETIHQIDPTSHSYEEGIHVIPAYLAKGIEFDAVIVYDASAHEYLNDLERHLLYTACTRAMHSLSLIAVGGVSPIIKEVPTNTYRFSKIHHVEN